MKGHPLVRVLSRLTLRAMKQARYATDNAGHFGLAFPVYCHFTSPIRRYPDLIVHRQLGRLMDGEMTAGQAEADAIEQASIESSQRERQAMEAERSMLDLRKAEFMTGHLLEPEPGTIISVLRFGFFVELDAYPVEGLVRVDGLKPDQYVFDEARHSLTGRRTGVRYRLGDRVLVQTTNISLRRREIDFALLEKVDPQPPSGPSRKHRGRRSRGSASVMRRGS
jgi:ribonuclease R